MRICDIKPSFLCRQHLLAEHRELHGLWNILTKYNCQGGYAKHPETLRWIGKSKALFKRHEDLVKEFISRGYHHKTPLDKKLAIGKSYQDVYVNSVNEQLEILKNKGCQCFI